MASGGIQAQALTVQTAPQARFSGDVGIISGVISYAPKLKNFHARINWGDGTSSTNARFALDAKGMIHVDGTHKYRRSGNYAIKVKVVGSPVKTATMSIASAVRMEIDSAARVSTPPANTGPGTIPGTGTGITISAVEGVAFKGSVGSFTYASPLAGALNPVNFTFRAIINWGDGVSSDGNAQWNGQGYDVVGSHTWNISGDYAVHADVSQTPGGLLIATIDSKAAVTVPPINPPGAGVTINAVAGTPFSGELGTFTNAPPTPPVENAGIVETAASINWGDGSASMGTLIAKGNNVYAVAGTHTWQKPATYTLQVTVVRGPHCVAGQPCPEFASVILAEFTSTAIVTPPALAGF